MNNREKIEAYLKRIGELNYIITVLRWEMDTIAPKQSYDYLIETSTKYELEAYDLETSEEFINLINSLIDSNEYKELTKEEQIYFEDLKEDFYKFKRVPKDFFEELCTLRSNSLNCWKEAKENDDYESFKPYLKRIIEYTIKYYKYMYPNTDNIYNSMLNDYEKGITSEQIDKLFSKLKEEIIPIVKQLKKKNISKVKNVLDDTQFINLAKYLLDYIGFDNERGALGIYTHGYTTKLNKNDVRITFSNRENPIDSISTIVHEGGHGIFDQNIGDNLSRYETYDVSKYALHESQSRFYENILGRRKSFFIPIYDKIKETLKTDLSIDEFVECFNDAKPSLVRTKADELTYCLHIIIRYEIEKDLINNKIDIDELPNIWNKKYEEYLGISSTNYKDGLLQDMHWSDGSFGYFPSYLLGSIFDGMLLELINKEIGDIDTLLSEGKIHEITKYLNNKIHKYGGAYNVNEVAKRVCGKELEVQPIINYFKEKYMNTNN